MVCFLIDYFMLFTSLSSLSLVSFAGSRACLIYMYLTVYEIYFILFIHLNIHFYFELCTYCNILDIYLSKNMNSVKYLLFYMKLFNYIFCNMFGSVLECYELTGVSLLWKRRAMPCTAQHRGPALKASPPWSQTGTQQGLSNPIKPMDQALTLINPFHKRH